MLKLIFSITAFLLVIISIVYGFTLMREDREEKFLECMPKYKNQFYCDVVKDAFHNQIVFTHEVCYNDCQENNMEYFNSHSSGISGDSCICIREDGKTKRIWGEA